jgi:hypothetical protein
MWQYMFSMPVMRSAWRRELDSTHVSTQYVLHTYETYAAT